MATDLNTLPTTSDEAAALATDVVRTTALQVGENYVQRKWPTSANKKEIFRVVRFLGAGTTPDALLAVVPSIKGLANDVSFWFEFINDAGEIETVGLTTDNGGALLDGEGNSRGRVTFRKISTEIYPSLPVKAPKAKKVIDPNATPVKRGRKPKATVSPVTPVIETATTEVPVLEAEPTDDLNTNSIAA
jgi:hypothetical protein